MLDTLLFRALMLVILLAPLPLGANREWAWTLAAVLVGGIGLVWAAGASLQPRDVSTSMPKAPAALFLAVLTWVVLQATTGPAHPLWLLSAEALTDDLPGVISLSPDDTLIAGLRLLCYGLVFWLSFQFARRTDRAREALGWLVVAGALYTVYGLVMFWGEFGMLLWFEDERFSKDVRGTFVNRNHFATWLGLCLLCTLAWFHQRVAVRRNPAYRVPATRDQRLERVVLKIWKPLMLIILMTAALVLTHSRAGFLSVLAGVLAWLWLVNGREAMGGWRTRTVVLSAVALSALVFWMTSEVLLQRVDRMNADLAGRMGAYELTREGIEDSPLMGFGYGSFADSFRLYRDERLEGHFDKAHNTYLENLFELGWPAAALLFAAIGWVVWWLVRGVRHRGRDWIFPATALAATVVVGVHSLFDFSLQIPAVAMTWSCLLGVGLAQSLPTRQ